MRKKKKIIGIILAAALVAGGLGGFAYATNNLQEPMTGQKLVGWGGYGTLEGYDIHSMFVFTNPDCVSEITIDRVSIFAFDGTVLYEGALLGDDAILEPHELSAVELHDYLGSEDLPNLVCTVEVFWTWTDKEGLPLTGWKISTFATSDDDGNIFGEMTESQMVNMEQKLKPKD